MDHNIGLAPWIGVLVSFLIVGIMVTVGLIWEIRDRRKLKKMKARIDEMPKYVIGIDVAKKEDYTALMYRHLKDND